MLLLTGATGLVGGDLLRLFAIERLLVVARVPDKVPADRRITVLPGDITNPECFPAELHGSIREILHCAADTRFGLPIEQARAVNVGGTRNLLNFARRCPRLEKFAYVSTVYVAGRTTGCIPAALLKHDNGFSNTYQQSKYEAEELVGEAMRDIPAVIFRISSMIGDSKSGRVRQFNHVHQLLKLLPHNILPVAPADPAAPVDLMPDDWAAPALASLFQTEFAPGRVYHVCAGPKASLTVRELIELTMEVFESLKWPPIRLPELVPLREYEEFVANSRQKSDRLLNELLRVLDFFLPHLGLYQAFEHTPIPGLPSPRDFYPKVVRYCLETDWGKRTNCASA